MITRLTDIVLINESEQCGIEYLVEVSGLSLSDLDDLVVNEIIVPIDDKEHPRRFQLRHVLTVKLARRLRDDFQLDRNGLALALTLLQRIDELKSELMAARVERG